MIEATLLYTMQMQYYTKNILQNI